MTAPVDTDTEGPAAPIIPDGVPENAVAIRFPVLAVEGMETSDGRYITPGGLDVRTLPIPLYAQTRSVHGSEGDAATWHVGALTEAVRRPGPEVVQLSTGQPFPDGTFVWQGTGWMYIDVPAAPQKSAYTLVKDGALRGNSVDLSGVEAELEYDDEHDGDPSRIVMHSGTIAATTLVGQPAFADAYVELDGVALEPAPALAAGGSPMWLSTDIGDECSPCAAGHALIADAAELARVTALAIGDVTEPAEPEGEPRHTGGMIALIPAAEDAARLAVAEGDPTSELHLTLAYLGDDVASWSEETTAAVHQIALEMTDPKAEGARRAAEAAERGEAFAPPDDDYRGPGQSGPLTVSVFSHAVFNPNGDNGFDPATVYLFDGSGDRDQVDYLALDATSRVESALGSLDFPEQHRPFVPHVTAGYGLPIDQLTETGPVVFDRLRVALGDSVTDYPLGGGAALVASAYAPPSADIFRDPGLSKPTALTVTEDGRVYGHLACWGVCHIGFQGKCVTPPRSRTDYAFFRTHTVRARDEDGEVITIPIGYGTVGTGHADIYSDWAAAVEHYDNTGTAAFELAVGEDEHGIWVAGRLMPGLSEDAEYRARGTVFSGDWRPRSGGLELVAALGVNAAGFPIPRARVASGAVLALTAAGVPSAAPVVAAASKESARVGRILDWVDGQRMRAETDAATAALLGLTEGADEEARQAYEGILATLERVSGES